MAASVATTAAVAEVPQLPLVDSSRPLMTALRLLERLSAVPADVPSRERLVARLGELSNPVLVGEPLAAAAARAFTAIALQPAAQPLHPRALLRLAASVRREAPSHLEAVVACLAAGSRPPSSSPVGDATADGDGGAHDDSLSLSAGSIAQRSIMTPGGRSHSGSIAAPFASSSVATPHGLGSSVSSPNYSRGGFEMDAASVASSIATPSAGGSVATFGTRPDHLFHHHGAASIVDSREGDVEGGRHPWRVDVASPHAGARSWHAPTPLSAPELLALAAASSGHNGAAPPSKATRDALEKHLSGNPAVDGDAFGATLLAAVHAIRALQHVGACRVQQPSVQEGGNPSLYYVVPAPSSFVGSEESASVFTTHGEGFLPSTSVSITSSQARLRVLQEGGSVHSDESGSDVDEAELHGEGGGGDSEEEDGEEEEEDDEGLSDGEEGDGSHTHGGDGASSAFFSRVTGEGGKGEDSEEGDGEEEEDDDEEDEEEGGDRASRLGGRTSSMRSSFTGIDESASEGGRSHVSGTRSHVSGTRSHVSGTRSHVSGTRSHVSGTRSHVSGTRSHISGTHTQSHDGRTAGSPSVSHSGTQPASPEEEEEEEEEAEEEEGEFEDEGESRSPMSMSRATSLRSSVVGGASRGRRGGTASPSTSTLYEEEGEEGDEEGSEFEEEEEEAATGNARRQRR